MVIRERFRAGGRVPASGSRHISLAQKAIHGAERGRMYEVLSALIPPAVVGGAFIYGVVKLVRSEAAGRRPAKQADPADAQKS